MVDRAPFEKEEDWGRTDANLPWKRERKGRGAWDGVGRIQGGGMGWNGRESTKWNQKDRWKVESKGGPNDRRLEIPSPDGKGPPKEEGGTSTPNRRKGIYLAPQPPTRPDGCPPRHRKRCSDREGTKNRKLDGE